MTFFGIGLFYSFIIIWSVISFISWEVGLKIICAFGCCLKLKNNILEQFISNIKQKINYIDKKISGLIKIIIFKLENHFKILLQFIDFEEKIENYTCSNFLLFKKKFIWRITLATVIYIGKLDWVSTRYLWVIFWQCFRKHL